MSESKLLNNKEAVRELELASDAIAQAARMIGSESKGFDSLRRASFHLLIAKRDLNDEIREEGR